MPGLYFSALRRTARHIKRGRRIYGIGQQRSRNGAHGIMRAPYARRARFRQWHGHGSGRRSPTCCARGSRRTACVSSRSTDASESCASRACACARLALKLMLFCTGPVCLARVRVRATPARWGGYLGRERNREHAGSGPLPVGAEILPPPTPVAAVNRERWTPPRHAFARVIAHANVGERRGGLAVSYWFRFR